MNEHVPPPFNQSVVEDIIPMPAKGGAYRLVIFSEDIDYIDASPLDSELDSLEEVKDFEIEALKDNPTPSSNFVTKSPSTSPNSPPLWDDYDDNLFDHEICDSVFYEDFSEVDALSSTNNEDKVFNPGILIHENLFEVTNFATPEKNVKKATNASLILEDLDPPLSLYELPFHKEVPRLGALLSF
ncbi:hypothetical protein Tco_0714159 [Tanacetum coccineum]